MAPQFETVKSFVDVPITADGVETVAFLEAADGLMNLFDLLGGAVFAFVQTDLRNNIAGVRARYNTHTSVSKTLEKLVQTEALEGDGHAQEDRSAELHVCFRRAYDVVLRHHHSFIIRSVVSVAIHAVPRRDDFFTRIAEGGPVDKLDTEMAKWLVALDALVIRLSTFLKDGNYGRV